MAKTVAIPKLWLILGIVFGLGAILLIGLLCGLVARPNNCVEADAQRQSTQQQTSTQTQTDRSTTTSQPITRTTPTTPSTMTTTSGPLYSIEISLFELVKSFTLIGPFGFNELSM